MRDVPEKPAAPRDSRQARNARADDEDIVGRSQLAREEAREEMEAWRAFLKNLREPRNGRAFPIADFVRRDDRD